MPEQDPFQKSLTRRQLFETSYKLTPLELEHWIEEHKEEEDLAVKLFLSFIAPLQLEIENLKFRPEMAIPLEKDCESQSPPF